MRFTDWAAIGAAGFLALLAFGGGDEPAKPPRILAEDMPLSIAAQEAVQAAGYACSSVLDFARWQFSSAPGMTIVCDRGRYAYEVADRGGRWVFTLE